MNLRQFVRENRAELDAAINAALYRYDGNGGKGTIPDPPPKRNDSERADWVQNDEGLYNWWKSTPAQR
jgi:hypothetical protein